MTVLSIILGVIMIIGGFSCMFTPLATFLSTGYYIGILFLIYGITGIVRGFKKEANVWEVILSVLAIIVGVVSLVRPGSTLIIDGVLIYVIAIWFVIQGIVSIVTAIQAKGSNSGWFWGIIVGILAIIVGGYSFAHPVFTAVTAGILIGFYFIEAGISLIMFAGAYSSQE